MTLLLKTLLLFSAQQTFADTNKHPNHKKNLPIAHTSNKYSKQNFSKDKHKRYDNKKIRKNNHVKQNTNSKTKWNTLVDKTVAGITQGQVKIDHAANSPHAILSEQLVGNDQKHVDSKKHFDKKQTRPKRKTKRNSLDKNRDAGDADTIEIVEEDLHLSSKSGPVYESNTFGNNSVLCFKISQPEMCVLKLCLKCVF